MISGTHCEQEQVAEGFYLFTRVLLHECTVCGVTVRIAVPVLPSETIEELRH